MNIEYTTLTKENLDEVAQMYTDYYNKYEDSCWELSTAKVRIAQYMTIQGAMCLVQRVEGKLSGVMIGYYKQYCDLLAYYLEEILIAKEYQNQGLGTHMMLEMEKIVRQNGVTHLELASVADEQHHHFYGKLGFYNASNLMLKAKHFD